jgi:hypothetical protein
MDNHYHLLIETPEGNLSSGMRQINGVYTQAFNRLHRRVGHLFQGRYKAILVEKESYLMELCRYVVLNPIRAKMHKHPREWAWSSYRETLKEEKGGVVDTDWILSQFDSRNKTEARRRYGRFVEEGITHQGKPWEEVTGQILLGGERFIEEIKEKIELSQRIEEIPRTQRFADRPSLKRLFIETNRRDEKIWEAREKWGYRLKEIGGYLGLHYSTISKIVKKVADKS